MCSPRLRVPPEIEKQISSYPMDVQAAKEAFNLYQAHQDLWDTLCVVWDDFALVWKYCETHGDEVLGWIATNGMQGYSLYIHEVIELEWYFEEGLNPYERPLPNEQERYGRAHSRALIEEHRYLQRRARAEGKQFSLHELILCNPFPADRKRDWKAVETYRRDELSPFDLSIASVSTQVENWYRVKGLTADSPASASTVMNYNSKTTLHRPNVRN